MVDEAQGTGNATDAAAVAAAAAAAGKTDAEKAAADAAAAKGATPGLAFSYDPKGTEQVFGKIGEDGKPANIQPKYWDPDKKQIKADVVFNQLRWAEGKLGKSLDILGAPPEGTEYEIKVPEALNVELPADDPAVKGFLEIARKHDVSQLFVSEVIEAVAKQVSGQQATTLTEEVKKLGDRGAGRLKDFEDYLKANFDPGQQATLKALVTTADQFEALEAVIRKGAPPKFMSKEDLAASASSQASLKAEWEAKYFAKYEDGPNKGERKMAVDPEYAKEVNALRDRVFGTQKRDQSGRVVNG